MTTQYPSLASMLITQSVTHKHHTHGWIETPDGRHFQPSPSDVRFIKGCRTPYIARQRKRPRWFARLMGIFA